MNFQRGFFESDEVVTIDPSEMQQYLDRILFMVTFLDAAPNFEAAVASKNTFPVKGGALWKKPVGLIQAQTGLPAFPFWRQGDRAGRLDMGQHGSLDLVFFHEDQTCQDHCVLSPVDVLAAQEIIFSQIKTAILVRPGRFNWLGLELIQSGVKRLLLIDENPGDLDMIKSLAKQKEVALIVRKADPWQAVQMIDFTGWDSVVYGEVGETEWPLYDKVQRYCYGKEIATHRALNEYQRPAMSDHPEVA